MAFEVELKAWVDEPEAVAEELSSRYSFECSFRKEDVYLKSPAYGGKREEFRVRREGEGEHAVVTTKKKSLRGGIEVNAEREFTVSDGDEFVEFMRRIGCVIFLRKVKTGRRFSSGDVTLELTHVERLGDFLEIEKMIDERTEENVSAAEAEIRELLMRAGIGEDRIERRYYADLLAEKSRDETSGGKE